MTPTTHPSGRRDCVCPRARHRHGTVGAYLRDRCRCFPCRIARSNASRVYAAGGNWCESERFPRVGVRRRLQALAAIGVNARAVSERTGGQLSVSHVQNLRASTDRHEWVTGVVWRAVTGVYDELWDRPDRSVNGRRCASTAARCGYAPPLAWDDDTIDDPTAKPHVNVGDSGVLDELAVELIMTGVVRLPAGSRAAERVEAVRRLAASGVDDGVIAARTGMSRGGVLKVRERHGIPAGVPRTGRVAS